MLTLSLVWLTLVLSLVITLVLPKRWPKISVVCLLSNSLILAMYYTPYLYGSQYYFLNMIKIVPLIMILVVLAQTDPAPNWSYRAMCYVFIAETLTLGWHIISGLTSPFYDQLSLATTIAELLILITGSLNVRYSNLHGLTFVICDYSRSDNWSARNKKSRGSSCPKT